MVESKDECGQAATYLGIKTNTMLTKVIEDKLEYCPHGCLHVDFGMTETESLWFLPNGSPSSSCGSNSDRLYSECICGTCK